MTQANSQEFDTADIYRRLTSTGRSDTVKGYSFFQQSDGQLWQFQQAMSSTTSVAVHNGAAKAYSAYKSL